MCVSFLSIYLSVFSVLSVYLVFSFKSYCFLNNIKIHSKVHRLVSLALFFPSQPLLKEIVKWNFAATQWRTRPMGRKSKAFSQTMVLSCQRPNGQSRHPLIADKTPASARSSTKFSKMLKNSRENKSSITLRLLIEVCTSSEMKADAIVKPRRSAGWRIKSVREWGDYSELSVWEALGATWPLIWGNILSVSHGRIKGTLPAVPVAKTPLTCLAFSSRLSASEKQSQVKYKCDTVVWFTVKWVMNIDNYF